MATTKRFYVFATFLLACAATALLVAAFSTAAWITSEMQPPGGNGLSGDISYGLFTGTVRRRMGAGTASGVSQIYITCVFGQNACAWSCQNDPERRALEVRLLLENGTRLETCPITAVPTSFSGRRLTPARRSGRADEVTEPSTPTVGLPDQAFVNMGLWVSTLLFLSVALLLSLCAALLGLLNTASNPTNPAIAVIGLFYWNGSAAVAELITLILWGVQYAVTLADNVAFAEVISGSFVSDGLAALGYSYWLVLVAMFVSIANIAILSFREYLLRIEPPPPTINPDDQNTDGAIFLY